MSINKMLALKELLGQEELLALISRMDTLPSLPAIYHELMESLQEPDSSMAQVGKIIAKDMAMTAKILQLVNSSFYGINTAVDNPSLAVNLLGMETIKALVLNIHIFSNVSEQESTEFGLHKLWNHSTNTAKIARMLAKEEGLNQHITETAYIGGLLHDVGKVVLATCFGAIYKEVVNAATFEQRTLCDVEREILHADHTAVGAYLLSLWGLPDSIVECVAYHHEPNQAPAKEFDAIVLVHTANLLEESHARPGVAEDSEIPFDLAYLERIGLAGRIPVWTKLTKQLLSD